MIRHPEIVTAHSMIDGTTAEISLSESSELRTGEETKWAHIGALVLDGLQMPLGPVIEKVMGLLDRLPVSDDERELARDYTRHYANMWRLGKAGDMNVVPWMWQTDRGSIIMPDITNGGQSAIYGKSTERRMAKQKGYDKRGPHPLDDEFLALTDGTRFESVIELARQQMHRATKIGMRLPGDDAVDLIIHPRGNKPAHEVITLDLTEAFALPGSTHLERLNREATCESLIELLRNRKALLAQRRQKASAAQVYTREFIMEALL